jgi:alpha-L-rhamnosidase
MIDASKATWVEPQEADQGRVFQRPAYHLARDFHVGGPVRGGLLKLTAHGLFEAFVNGERVGDRELLPGFTAYRRRLEVHTFDVTGLLRPGDNAVGVLLSDGWWRSQHSSERGTDSYGTALAVLGVLEVTLESGGTVTVGTGPSWRSCPSHILGADMIAGEVHDLRRRLPGWAEAGADRTSWDPARPADHGTGRLCEPTAPPVRRMEELSPVSVREIAPGRHVVDFGQNSNGWVRLDDLGPAGRTLTLVYGEALDAGGDVTQRNVSHEDRFPDRPFQTDVVTSAGDGSSFEPRHSTKGFRYVRVEGHPGPLAAGAITSVVVRSDLQPIGGFHCSDERVNRLHAAADWSLRTNACDIPTDCPTRERAGWTGDWQVFVESAAFLYDVVDFSLRWLADVAAEQREDGAVLNFVPDPHDFSLPQHARWAAAQGSAGWGDAACHVPFELYRATGRTDFLEPQLEMMRRWVDFAAGRAATGRHPARAAARPDPLPHERYLWDSGFHFGEWAEPAAVEEPPGAAFGRVLRMDHGPTATAYLYRSASELSELAALAGDEGTAGRAGELAAHVRRAWQLEFLDEVGRVQPQTQANLVRALAFGLLPDDAVTGAVEDLVGLVRAADTHLGTGFLSTPFLLPVLADHGHADLAYELLFQDSAPSWLHMIDAGATTIWEHWNGFDRQGEGSLNHYSKGAVVNFLHRYVGGLRILEPGYRRFGVAPGPGGGISSAEVHHLSPHGRIEVRWRVTGGRGELDLVVPPGTTAEVRLPGGGSRRAGSGGHRFSW